MDNQHSVKNLNFLHVTDCHLSSKTDYKEIDIKLPGADVRQPLRQDVLDRTLEAIPIAASLLQEAFWWTDEDKERQINEYRDEIISFKESAGLKIELPKEELE